MSLRPSCRLSQKTDEGRPGAACTQHVPVVILDTSERYCNFCRAEAMAPAEVLDAAPPLTGCASVARPPWQRGVGRQRPARPVVACPFRLPLDLPSGRSSQEMWPTRIQTHAETATRTRTRR